MDPSILLHRSRIRRHLQPHRRLSTSLRLAVRQALSAHLNTPRGSMRVSESSERTNINFSNHHGWDFLIAIQEVQVCTAPSPACASKTHLARL